MYVNTLLFSGNEESVINALLPPSHSGYGVNPILVGRSLDGMSHYVPLGGEQNASHMVILGRTRSGKSTLVKWWMLEIVRQYGSQMRLVVADLKGEYVQRIASPDGTVTTETLIPHATIVGKRDFLPLGWRTLRCENQDDAHTEAVNEARTANMVLQLLGFPRKEEIVSTLMRAWKWFRQQGGDEKSYWSALKFIYNSAIQGLPRESVAATLFGGSGKVSQVHHAVIDLSWASFRSPEQQAAFLWAIAGFIPLSGASRFIRTVLCIEEFQLLPKELLGTLLRVCGGKGVSTILITQAYEQVAQLGGAGRQFSAAVVMAPQIDELESVARVVFEMSLRDYLESKAKRDILELASKPFGWGGIISPVYGINTAVVTIPDEFLKRIQSFNIGIQDGRGFREGQDEI